MQRDLLQVVILLAVGAVVAAAANVGWHDVDWIRPPVAPPPTVPPDAILAQANANNSVDSATSPGVGAPSVPSADAPGVAPSTQQNGNEPAREKLGPGEVGAGFVLKCLEGNSACFVDARSAEEFNDARLKGAINVPSEAIYANTDTISLIPPDHLVIVYCGGDECEASQNVADALRRDFAYTSVYVHHGGWAEMEALYEQFSPYMVTGGEP